MSGFRYFIRGLPVPGLFKVDVGNHARLLAAPAFLAAARRLVVHYTIMNGIHLPTRAVYQFTLIRSSTRKGRVTFVKRGFNWP